jgi:hypothetical protein
MKTISSLLLILLFFTKGYLFGQDTARKLDKTVFEKEIINQWWSFEDKEKKTDCDMRLLIFKTSGFELNCVNWVEGFSGSKCEYDTKIDDIFFEIKVKNCINKSNVSHIYGYLSERGNLFLLLNEKELKLNNSLLKENNWLKFEKIKN